VYTVGLYYYNLVSNLAVTLLIGLFLLDMKAISRLQKFYRAKSDEARSNAPEEGDRGLFYATTSAFAWRE
jgi:hypothetical protein